MNFWAIFCLSCGVNCDLMTDRNHRIICRECFKEMEDHHEVGSIMEDFTAEEAALADNYQRQFIRDNIEEGLLENTGETK